MCLHIYILCRCVHTNAYTMCMYIYINLCTYIHRVINKYGKMLIGELRCWIYKYSLYYSCNFSVSWKIFKIQQW